MLRRVAQIITSDVPAHMYFDIEFSRAANPTLHGPDVVDRIVRMVKRLFL